MTTICGFCGEGNCSKTCAKCCQQYYCSKVCQEKAWPVHINVCNSIPIYVVQNSFDLYQKGCLRPDDVSIDYVSFDEEEAKKWMAENIIYDTSCWQLKTFQTVCEKNTKEFYYRPCRHGDIHPVLYKSATRAEKDNFNKGNANSIAVSIGEIEIPNDGLRWQKRMKNHYVSKYAQSFSAQYNRIPHLLARPMLEMPFHSVPLRW